ncbi:hypothetical protein MCEREM21A_02349 [Sphingomonadaceae bacterium]
MADFRHFELWLNLCPLWARETPLFVLTIGREAKLRLAKMRNFSNHHIVGRSIPVPPVGLALQSYIRLAGSCSGSFCRPRGIAHGRVRDMAHKL